MRPRYEKIDATAPNWMAFSISIWIGLSGQDTLNLMGYADKNTFGYEQTKKEIEQLLSKRKKKIFVIRPEILKQFRKLKKMSLDVMSRTLNMNRRAYRDKENGTTSVRVQEVNQIANILDIDELMKSEIFGRTI
jgi:DNA-binding transcriptional regulator YiaG